MRAELPARLTAGPRVIKRNRGNGGQGVWKVETLARPGNRPMVRVLDATKDVSEELALEGVSRAVRQVFRRWLRGRSAVRRASERRCGALLYGGR